MKNLDNPKEYFDSLSSEEFEQLLNEYGFKYTNTKDSTKQEEKHHMDVSELVEKINDITMQYVGRLSIQTDKGLVCTKVSINKDNIIILKFEEK